MDRDVYLDVLCVLLKYEQIRLCAFCIFENFLFFFFGGGGGCCCFFTVSNWADLPALKAMKPDSVAQSDARPTSDQDVAGSIPTRSGNIHSWRLMMTYEGPAKSFVTGFGLLQCYVLTNIFLLQTFKVFPLY